jgi:hypothetical protein
VSRRPVPAGARILATASWDGDRQYMKRKGGVSFQISSPFNSALEFRVLGQGNVVVGEKENLLHTCTPVKEEKVGGSSSSSQIDNGRLLQTVAKQKLGC